MIVNVSPSACSDHVIVECDPGWFMEIIGVGSNADIGPLTHEDAMLRGTLFTIRLKHRPTP